ncbi:MAG: hypothetical protein Q7W51_04585 [Coriobacteriia bacterium]|nr:hypothetical protein [Coriobacteriia bacterium]
MTAEPSATGTGKSVPVWVLVVTLLLVAIIAGGTAWYLSSRATDDDASVAEDATETETEAPETETEAEVGSEVVETGEDVAEVPKPSYVRYAYVRAVTGSTGAWEASVDLFDIFTGAEADAYASSHGMTVPGNGILYVNESETPESVPLSDAALITYNTGGVEGLETHSATIEQLRDYAAGSTTAMPDAFRDQWKVTVENGVITRVEMIAVAD